MICLDGGKTLLGCRRLASREPPACGSQSSAHADVSHTPERRPDVNFTQVVFHGCNAPGPKVRIQHQTSCIEKGVPVQGLQSVVTACQKESHHSAVHQRVGLEGAGRARAKVLPNLIMQQGGPNLTAALPCELCVELLGCTSSIWPGYILGCRHPKLPDELACASYEAVPYWQPCPAVVARITMDATAHAGAAGSLWSAFLGIYNCCASSRVPLMQKTTALIGARTRWEDLPDTTDSGCPCPGVRWNADIAMPGKGLFYAHPLAVRGCRIFSATMLQVISGCPWSASRRLPKAQASRGLVGDVPSNCAPGGSSSTFTRYLQTGVECLQEVAVQ